METLDSNIQKYFYLVLGQYMDIMMTNLRTLFQWEKVKNYQDILLLLQEIKKITFRFEDQKYKVLSIHNSKQ